MQQTGEPVFYKKGSGLFGYLFFKLVDFKKYIVFSSKIDYSFITTDY